jgi:hypothetical protein
MFPAFGAINVTTAKHSRQEKTAEIRGATIALHHLAGCV